MVLMARVPRFWGADLNGPPEDEWGGAESDDSVPVPTPRPPYVTSSGGDAEAQIRHLQDLDPRLSPLLGQQHWVAVPNSVSEDSTANMNFNEQPRGYQSAGADSKLRYSDLEGTYVDKAHNRNDPHIIAATGQGRLRSGSFDTLFHETAHGVDEAPDNASDKVRKDGLRSAQREFVDAYNNDKSLWTPGTDDYYFKNDAGGSEAFAESFARYFGGDPTLQQKWPGMYKYWADRYPNPGPGYGRK